MLFGGEMFRKVALTAFMAVRRGGMERLLFLLGGGQEALILALRRIEE